MSRAIIDASYTAFNAGDTEGMIACLTPDVAHHVNEGGVRVGIAKFRDFCAHMTRCYNERLTEIVVMISEGGTRAAAEFTVNGQYLATDQPGPVTIEVDPAAIAAPRLTGQVGNFAHWPEGRERVKTRQVPAPK